jgi:PKHD-type hydroxylase
MQAAQTQASLPSNAYLTRHLVFENFFNAEECEQIAFADLTVYQAEISYHLPEEASLIQLNLRHRNALNKALPRLPKYEWIYARLIHKIHELNQKYYHFKLSSLSEPQILEYQNTGFYGTHVDIGTDALSTRKLTLVVFLSPASAYTGGDLVIKPAGVNIPNQQGNLVVLPAYMPHEVQAVTQGVRRTLVTWVLGECFR